MELMVNGEPRSVPDGTTVAGLLRELELLPALVVVERNREIVPRDAVEAVALEPGDQLELVHFVGGG
jgi:thiamine biosynthesis protein ThiS